MTMVGQQRDQHAFGKIETKSVQVLEKTKNVGHPLPQMNQASLWFKIQFLEVKKYVDKNFILLTQMEWTQI